MHNLDPESRNQARFFLFDRAHLISRDPYDYIFYLKYKGGSKMGYFWCEPPKIPYLS